MKKLFKVFGAFFRIGLCTIGGGYAMLPMLEREVVQRRKWVTKDELLDYFAIGQCTPGIIAVNTATLIGYRMKGIWGGVFATAGFVLPSLVIILSIAKFLESFAHIMWISHAFAGVRVGVVVLILGTIIKLWKQSIADKPALLIFALVFGLGLFLNVSPVYFIMSSGLLGVAIKKVRGEI